MAEREERICIPFTHTYDQFTTFFYDGRVYLSDTSYPIGQCCVDIANMDEEVYARSTAAWRNLFPQRGRCSRKKRTAPFPPRRRK